MSRNGARKTSCGSIQTYLSFSFQKFPMILLVKSREVILRMSIIGIPLPENVGLSVSEQSVEVPAPELSAAELSGYRKSMPKSDAVKKFLGPISENVRNQIWLCPNLSIYSNSEFAYAIFLIAVAFSWGKGGREIAESRPLSTISAIPSHVLSTTDAKNRDLGTTGKLPCEDTFAKWPPFGSTRRLGDVS